MTSAYWDDPNGKPPYDKSPQCPNRRHGAQMPISIDLDQLASEGNMAVLPRPEPGCSFFGDRLKPCSAQIWDSQTSDGGITFVSTPTARASVPVSLPVRRGYRGQRVRLGIQHWQWHRIQASAVGCRNGGCPARLS